MSWNDNNLLGSDLIAPVLISGISVRCSAGTTVWAANVTPPSDQSVPNTENYTLDNSLFTIPQSTALFSLQLPPFLPNHPDATHKRREDPQISWMVPGQGRDNPWKQKKRQKEKLCLMPSAEDVSVLSRRIYPVFVFVVQEEKRILSS